MKLGTPVVMSAMVNVPADSAPVMFDIAQLTSPQRQALAIHEIRFHTVYPTGAVPPVPFNPSGNQGYVNMGYELSATIHVGQMALADDVPVWSFSPVCDRAMETIQNLMGCYRWRLLKPLFLPSGMGFRISMIRSLVANVLGTFSTNPLPVWCTILGQIVEGNFPRTMNVPFAMTYAPNPVASGKFVSTQQDLLNNTRSLINLKYAVGRLAFIYATTGIAAPGPLAETWDVQDAGIYVSAQCEMGSDADRIIPMGTEFNAAFDYARRTLRLADYPLEAGSRLTFSMTYPTGTPVDFVAPAGSTYWAPNVTVVGSRQENVP